MDQITIGQRIKKRREQIGLTMQDIADKLDVNRSSVMRWENGETNRIKLPIVEKLAQILQTSPDYLMGYKDEEGFVSGPVCTKSDVCFLPVLKDVCRTGNLFDEENILHYELAEGAYRHGDYFYLLAAGDSMAPHLREHDLILVRQQKNLKSGQLGVFIVDEKDCIIREYSRQGEELVLRAFNPYYPALHLAKDEVNRLRIVGVVKESKHRW